MRTILLLTVYLFLVKSEKPTITMFPKYGVVYWGDTIVLKCSKSPTAEWLVNGTTRQLGNNQSLILDAVSSKHSGDYQCQSTEKSDTFTINVMDYLPPALLTLVSENAVVNVNASPSLQLFSEEDVKNWECRVLRKDVETYLRTDGKVSGTNFQFHVDIKGAAPEIVWCKKRGTKGPNIVRSNSVIFRSSGNEVLLEIPPEPAVLGEPLTLTCEVRGGAKIQGATFYKDNKEIEKTDGSYKISSVTEEDQGSYRCQATFQYIFIKPHGALKQNVPSEAQKLFIRDGPPSTRITDDDSGLTCSCPNCPTVSSYNWYYREPGVRTFTWLEDKTKTISYQPGKYVCQALWDNKASRPGKISVVTSGSGSGTNPIIFVVLVLILAGLVLVIVGFLCRNKRRQESDGQGGVPMKSVRRKKAAEEDVEKDDAYQPLKGQDKSEYQTLPAKQGEGGDGGYEAVGAARSGDGADGGYEALKAKGQSDVYHTLQSTDTQDAAKSGDGADGGYEALKAKGQSDVYHTLQATDTQGAEGGYEALKGKQSDTYHTLKLAAEGGGDGEYEAIKGERADAAAGEADEKGLYQKLGAGEGDGGYEELKMKKQADSKTD